MKRIVAGLAVISSLAAFLVVVGGGLTLLAIENSGERGAGAMLALAGVIAFAAALILVFVRDGAFAGRSGRAGAWTMALVGALPPAALGVAAFRVSGVPFASATPALDWMVFLIGLVFALGAVSLLATGYRRTGERSSARARPEAVRPPPQRAPTQAAPTRQPAARPAPAPRAAVTSAARDLPPSPHHPTAEQPRRPAPPPISDDDDVRVTPAATPVDLPSIGRFRRR